MPDRKNCHARILSLSFLACIVSLEDESRAWVPLGNPYVYYNAMQVVLEHGQQRQVISGRS